MTSLTGFVPGFLGVAGLTVELPSFSPALVPDVYSSPSLRNTSYLDYPHFSLAMSTATRSALVVALNVDQGTLRRTDRSGWSTDPRLPASVQLDNDYYAGNPYDRGHLARRASASWGVTLAEAQAASDASMTYTNAALQRDTYNQDEWLALENYVKNFEADANGRLCVFTGPVYGPPDAPSAVYVTPRGRGAPALVPAAFFKILSYATPAGTLGVSAFLMAQDTAALRDKRGADAPSFDLRAYQVTVMEIEALTGLVFSDALRNANPLRFTPPGTSAPQVPEDNLGGEDGFPERRPIDGPGDVVPPVGARPGRGGGGVGGGRAGGVRIVSALVNPTGRSERADESVTLRNTGSTTVDVAAWSLTSAPARAAARLGGDASAGAGSTTVRLSPGETRTFRLGLPLGNSGGVLRLINGRGVMVDEASYTRAMVAAAGEGNEVVFTSPT
ncbi:hypothetical protein MMPV_003102 [Pyropia vietnamensis]